MIHLRQYILAIIICSALFSCLDSVSGQDIPLDVEEILGKHYKAIGLDQKKKIQSLVSIGALSQLGTNLPISIIQKRPSKYRMDVHLNDGRISQGYNGEYGWSLNPFVSPDTAAITGPELNQLRESADFDGVLVNYKKLGYNISYDAAGMWNNSPVLILDLKKDTGVVLRIFLDADTYLILKTEATYIIEGLKINAQSEFSDYRKTGGVNFPYRIINRNGQLMTEMLIDTIRINENLEDILFR